MKWSKRKGRERNMDHLYNALDKPLIFAHRGASKYAPENTVSAFHKAIALGAKAIELDVMLSKDKKIVVIHDVDVSRTTNGIGRVDEMTYDQLIKLDAGSWFSQEFKAERLPRLEDIFDQFGNNCLINIELKNYHSPKDDLPNRVMALISKYNLTDSVIISSFLPNNLKIIKSYRNKPLVALLTLTGFKGWITRSKLFFSYSPNFIHPAQNDVTFTYIQKEHARGRKVHVYTVNEKRIMENLFRWNVDGIFTDDLKLAIKTAGQD